jgi:hypothetical protein
MTPGLSSGERAGARNSCKTQAESINERFRRAVRDGRFSPKRDDGDIGPYIQLQFRSSIVDRLRPDHLRGRFVQVWYAVQRLSLGITFIVLASAVLLVTDRDRRTTRLAAARVYRVASRDPKRRGNHVDQLVVRLPVNRGRHQSREKCVASVTRQTRPARAWDDAHTNKDAVRVTHWDGISTKGG